jgi:hypothetical protein
MQQQLLEFTIRGNLFVAGRQGAGQVVAEMLSAVISTPQKFGSLFCSAQG